MVIIVRMVSVRMIGIRLEEIIEENHYYLRVKNGRIVAKRLNQEIPPAYDLIYEADPNNTDLQ